MILLLGKNSVVEEYAKEILKLDMRNDIVYYPDTTTHYTELQKYVEIAKEEHPPVITTQNIEMIDILLNSDLDLKVVTVCYSDKKIKARVLNKEKALYVKNVLKLELR